MEILDDVRRASCEESNPRGENVPRTNKIRCKKCDDVIESKHHHDFKRCKCGEVFVDGGSSYFRAGWGSGVSFEDAIEVIQSAEEDRAPNE